MEKEVYVQCHILKSDGTETLDAMNMNDIFFDISKYTDKNGELYFVEEIIDGQKKRMIVSKEVYLQKHAGVYTPKVDKKKIGFGHILFAYVFLPIYTILYFLNSIASIYVLIQEGGGILYAPYVISQMMMAISGFFLFASLIRKDKSMLTMLHIFFTVLILAAIASDIGGFIIHESMMDYIPGSTIISIIFLLIMNKYYTKRVHHFIKDEKTYPMIIIMISFSATTFIYSIIIYVYSVVDMFGMSTINGLIALLLPGIGQFIYMGIIGYDTLYTYAFLYAAFAVFASNYVAKRIEYFRDNDR